MTRRSNGTEFTLDDNTKAVFDAIVKVENLRDTKVSFGVPDTKPESQQPAQRPKPKHKTRAAKTSDMPTPPVFDNITDLGTPHKYTNGKKVKPSLMEIGEAIHYKILGPDTFRATKDAGMPTSRPAEQSDTLINLSTEKPAFTLADFDKAYPGTLICSGVAYYARNGYNRHGIGTPKRFVAVMGGGGESWAIYVGGILAPMDWIESDGDKVCLEAHIKQLIDCEEALPYYRF